MNEEQWKILGEKLDEIRKKWGVNSSEVSAAKHDLWVNLNKHEEDHGHQNADHFHDLDWYVLQKEGEFIIRCVHHSLSPLIGDHRDWDIWRGPFGHWIDAWADLPRTLDEAEMRKGLSHIYKDYTKVPPVSWDDECEFGEVSRRVPFLIYASKHLAPYLMASGAYEQVITRSWTPVWKLVPQFVISLTDLAADPGKYNLEDPDERVPPHWINQHKDYQDTVRFLGVLIQACWRYSEGEYQCDKDGTIRIRVNK